MDRVRVLVVPIFKRQWMLHAWTEVAGDTSPAVPWHEGNTISEKTKLLFTNSKNNVMARVGARWHELQTAPAGSFNNTLFRLAQSVLSRVDPVETCLKAIPRQAAEVEIRHPTSIPARLVRRRLRLLLARRGPFHEQRTFWWAAAALPQVPIILLPLPNIPLYYTIWRIASNYSAAVGAKALDGSLQRSALLQRYQLALQLQAMVEVQGFALRPGEWPERLLAELPGLATEVSSFETGSCSDGGDRERGGSTNGGGGGCSADTTSRSDGEGQTSANAPQQPLARGLPAPLMISDDFLEQVVQPAVRRTTVLGDDAARSLTEHYHQDHLMEHYDAVLRRCLPPLTKTSE